MIPSKSILKKFNRNFFKLIFLCCAVWWGFSIGSSVYAQFLPTGTAKDITEDAVVEWPEDPLGRRTPRGTVSGFIRAVADGNYSKAAMYFNLPPTLQEGEEGAELALLLQRLLDKSGTIFPYSLISNEPGGEPDDNLSPNLERVGTLSLEGETISINLEEIKGPEGGPIWVISSETIEKLSVISGDVAIPLVDKLLPNVLEETKWGGVSIGQWLSMLILLIAAYLLAWALVTFALFLIPKVWKKATTEPTEGVIKAFALPIRLFLTVWLFVTSAQEIGLSIIVRQRFGSITVIIGLAAFLLLLWRLTDFIASFSERRLTLRGHISGVSAVLFLGRLTKIGIIVFGVIAILGAFGVDVTTGLAALGIGGIALALGAQKTVENFVGSVTLIGDQPIRVGDFCKVGDTIGTVESIGMRSTRIRTLDRTVVTIPNGELSSQKIENYAHRDRFRFYTVLNFRYETSADQMRFLLVELRSILYAHPKVDPDPARVRFAGFGATSLNIEIFAFILAKDFNEFVEVREDILLRMMDVVEESGTSFAFPSQTLYLARDKGLSKEKSEEAEKKVRDWKENGELQIPFFDEQRINELKDTISYPPKNSVLQDKVQGNGQDKR